MCPGQAVGKDRGLLVKDVACAPVEILAAELRQRSGMFQAGNSVRKRSWNPSSVRWRTPSKLICPGGAGQITQEKGKLSHIFYPDVKKPARVQEENFPKLIFVIQKSSVSAPQHILTTAPDLPLPFLLTESLT